LTHLSYHMAVVFFAVRALLALIPGLSVSTPIGHFLRAIAMQRLRNPICRRTTEPDNRPQQTRAWPTGSRLDCMSLP